MLSVKQVCRPCLTSLLQRCQSHVNIQHVRAVQIRAGTKFSRSLFWGSVIAGSAGAGLFLLYGQDSLNALSWSKAKPAPPSLPSPNSSPLYSREDVEKHNSLQNGVWVTYEGHVYDITKFVGHHPGGDKILLAAGGAIEPFWAMYGVHQTDEVLKMLEEYRIGDLRVLYGITFNHGECR